jgi:hypothetical protein
MSPSQRIRVLPHSRDGQIVLPSIPEVQVGPDGYDRDSRDGKRNSEPLKPGERRRHGCETDQVLGR